MKRKLCIVIHDVAGPTWPECQALLAMLDSLGSPPITFLVVPDFHGRGPIADAHEVRNAIDRRICRGSEVSLHGLLHQDDLTRPSRPLTWIARRVMTAGEGEFAALSAMEADRRIGRGLDMLRHCGWEPAGFVPPAWLASSGTMQALARHSFRYTSTCTSLILLATPRSIFAPCLTASVRSISRRAASHVALAAIQRATRETPIVRIALHPADARHPSILHRWQRTLVQLLSERDPVTKSQALDWQLDRHRAGVHA